MSISKDSLLDEIREAVAKKKTETGERNAVVRVLAKHGAYKTPKIETGRFGKGSSLRVYIWDTKWGTLVLSSGPSVEGEVQYADKRQLKDAPEGSYHVLEEATGTSKIIKSMKAIAARQDVTGSTTVSKPKRKKAAPKRKKKAKAKVPGFTSLGSADATFKVSERFGSANRTADEFSAHVSRLGLSSTIEEGPNRDLYVTVSGENLGQIKEAFEKFPGRGRLVAESKEMATAEPEEIVFVAKTRGGKYRIEAEYDGDTYTIRRYTSGRQTGGNVGIRSMRDLQIELGKLLGGAIIDGTNYILESWDKTFDMAEFEFVRDKYVAAFTQEVAIAEDLSSEWTEPEEIPMAETFEEEIEVMSAQDKIAAAIRAAVAGIGVPEGDDVPF